MTSNLENQLIAWASTHNLNWMIVFHNYVRGLFKDQIQELEKSGNKDTEYKLHKSAFYDYDRILNINTLLMMYSYLEEWLYHCWKTCSPRTDLVEREGSWGVSKTLPNNLVSICHQLFGMNCKILRRLETACYMQMAVSVCLKTLKKLPQ